MDIKKAGLVLLGGAIGTKVGGILFKFILVNAWDPATYGKFAIFLILFDWLLMVSTFNVTIGLAKFVAEGKKQKKLFYSSALIGCVPISLVISAVLATLAPQISDFTGVQSVPAVLFLAAVLPFAVIYNLTIFYFRGLYRMGVSALSEIILAAVKVLALIVLLWTSCQYPAYAAFLISFVVLDIILFISKKPSDLTKTIKTMFKPFKMLFLYSLPIFASESLAFIGRGLDRLFLAKFWTTGASGIYDVAVAFCLGYMLIANSYANVLLPVASKNRRHPSKLKKNLVKISLYVIGLYGAYTALILLLAGPVVGILNPQYMSVTEFLAPMAFAYMAMGFLSLLSHFVNSIGLQKYAVYTAVTFLFMSFVLNFYLVPQLKYMGAVAAVLASALTSTVLLALLIKRRFKLKE